MSHFDPKKHRVVAVPYRDDDPERGQHFHVDLDELVTASFDAPPSEDGALVVGTGNPFLIKRLEALEARVTELAARVDEIDDRPYVSRETLAQLDDGLNAKITRMIEEAVNRAMGDVRSRLITIEKTTTTTTGGEADSSKLTRLAEMIGSLGKYVSEIETTVETRHADIESRYGELAEHIAQANVNTMKVSTRLYRALQALEHDEERGAAA